MSTHRTDQAFASAIKMATPSPTTSPSPRRGAHPLLSTPFYLSLCFHYLEWRSFLTAATVHRAWHAGVKKAAMWSEAASTTSRTLQIDCKLRSNALTWTIEDAPPAHLKVQPTDMHETAVPGGMWPYLRSLDLAVPSPPLRNTAEVSHLARVLGVCTKLRQMRVCLLPAMESTLRSFPDRRPNPHLTAFTPRLLEPLRATMTHLVLTDVCDPPQFDADHATLVFSMVTTHLTQLRHLTFGWRTVNQQGSLMPTHLHGFRSEAGDDLQLESLLQLEQLESLHLLHMEFTLQAGQIIHQLSSQHQLTSVTWQQREALVWGPRKDDHLSQQIALDFPNAQPAFDALLSTPPSNLSSFCWIQPNGRFSDANLKSLLALPQLTSLRVHAKNLTHLATTTSVVANHQQGEGRVAHVRRCEEGGQVLRTLDINCASDGFADSRLTGESWCSALAKLPTLTRLTLRMASLDSSALQKIGVGLCQLKHLTLHGGRSSALGLEQTFTPALFMHLESFELLYDRGGNPSTAGSLARGVLTLPSLRRIAIVEVLGFQLRPAFASALTRASLLEEVHIVRSVRECKKNPWPDTRAADSWEGELTISSVLDQPKTSPRWHQDPRSEYHPTRCCIVCREDYTTLSRVRRDRHEQQFPLFEARVNYALVGMAPPGTKMPNDEPRPVSPSELELASSLEADLVVVRPVATTPVETRSSSTSASTASSSATSSANLSWRRVQ